VTGGRGREPVPEGMEDPARVKRLTRASTAVAMVDLMLGTMVSAVLDSLVGDDADEKVHAALKRIVTDMEAVREAVVIRQFRRPQVRGPLPRVPARRA